jgi:glutamate transport system substrate-binding protein
MKSTRIRALALVAVAAFALSACGGGDDDAATDVAEKPSFAAGTTMAKLADAGKITVGTKFDQPGFGFKGLSDDPEGFDVEIAKIIAAKLGIQPDAITYVESVSAVREEFIEQGKVDMVVATYTINDKRKERITFAGPYYTAGQQIMVKTDNTAITGPESLKANPAQKVCSVTGSTPAENIKQYLAAPDQLVTLPKYEDCEAALKNGTNGVAAVTTDNVILLGFVSESDGAYKLVGEQFTEEPYGIGIKKGDTAFCDFINTTLKEASDSGAYKKAWEDTAAKAAEGVEAPTLPAADACA